MKALNFRSWIVEQMQTPAGASNTQDPLKSKVLRAVQTAQSTPGGSATKAAADVLDQAQQDAANDADADPAEIVKIARAEDAVKGTQAMKKKMRKRMKR